ncbi:MAG: hypothetical protein H6799_02680 [Candidatus Nomurabacteria bacterium]|nr:MAG: hypothetical protein H6799_02680 [Candidatus Nomurabacteria bacterium]HRV76089.1 hypothetical protein [Candidatus Saccharimonadales bacterium]
MKAEEPAYIVQYELIRFVKNLVGFFDQSVNVKISTNSNAVVIEIIAHINDQIHFKKLICWWISQKEYYQNKTINITIKDKVLLDP